MRVYRAVLASENNHSNGFSLEFMAHPRHIDADDARKEKRRERLRFIINLAIPFPCFSNKIMRKRKKKFHRESEHKKPQATS